MSIGQIGLLRSDQVIFYHPLDNNLREHTTTEVWNGTASFVPGKVGPALSAITSSNIDLGDTGLTVGSASGNGAAFNPNTIVALSDTLVVTAWSDNLITKSFVKAGTVVGTGIVWGSKVVYNPGPHPGASKHGDLVKLDATRFAIAFSATTSEVGGHIIIGSVSGDTTTLGAIQKYTSSAMYGEQRLEFLDTDKLMLFYRAGDGKAKGLIARVSGTDVFYGTPQQFSNVNQPVNLLSANTMALAPLSPNKVIACTNQDRNGNGESTSRVGLINGPSGTDISWGDPVPIDVTTLEHIDIIKINTTTALLGRTGLNQSFTRVATISGPSGTTITWSPQVFYTSSPTMQEVDMALLSLGDVVMYYRDTAANSWVQLASVSGTVFTVGAETIVSDTILTPIRDFYELNVIKLTNTKFMLGMENFDGLHPGYGELNYIIGSLNVSAGISGTSVNYPSVSGATRITLAMWANDLTRQGSTVSIFRGYSIAMTSTTISLGGSTAVWNAASIAALMTTMNDNNDHLLVLDFENTGGTTWVLSSSTDGAPFTSHGSQDSGTQIVATTDTNPRVVITDGAGIEQWIDELAMWAGDKTIFTQFTETELANLFILANINNNTMDEYDIFLDSLTDVPGFSTILVPDTWAENIDAPSKTVTMTQNVTLSPETSGTSVTGIVNLFDKTIPFDCEIVGVQAVMTEITNADFNGTGGFVNIVVESSDKPDISPRVPFNEVSLPSPVWQTLVPSVQCKTVPADGLCLDAPADGTNVIDQTYISLRQFASLRAIVTAQVEDAYPGGSGVTPVSMTIKVELRPVNIKERRYL